MLLLPPRGSRTRSAPRQRSTRRASRRRSGLPPRRGGQPREGGNAKQPLRLLLRLRLRLVRLRRRSRGRTALRSRPSPRPCRHHLLRAAAAEGAADRAARLPTCSTASGPVGAVHRQDPAHPRRRAATAPSRHRAVAARRPLRDRAVGSSFSAEPARGRRALLRVLTLGREPRPSFSENLTKPFGSVRLRRGWRVGILDRFVRCAS